MLYLSFIHPDMLWLLLLLMPLWAIPLYIPRRLVAWRFWTSLGLRSLLLVLLVLSLAGVQFVQSVDQVTTVFLLDSSDSITPSARSRAEAFVQNALRSKREDDQAAVVVFGENALVERTPSDSPLLARLLSEPVAGRTNIEDALQLGMALFPADSQKRLVLLTDGGENTGTALTAAQLAATRHIPIEVVDLTSPGSRNEALVADLTAPGTAREGQEIELVATVESTLDQTARMRILSGQEVVVDREVQLTTGSNQFRVQVPAEGRGLRRYRVQIEPQQDDRVQNNESAALVQVQGPPRVLLVESSAGEARNLKEALEAAQIDASITPPADIPIDLTGLSSYEAVVLVNVPARELPVKAIAALPSYVRDLGKGLVMIGGDKSYGVGGYGRTAIEEALPVYMDVRNREERPDLALVFVIDKSGSMDACHCSGPNRRTAQLMPSGEAKIDIAKEAVIQASEILGAHDTLGVVTFDSSASWAFPATEGASPSEVADAIANVNPQGGTNVRSGLLAAEDALNETSARIKHVILLTDGWGEGGSNLDIAQRMRDQGITLSVVAAGGGSAAFLENLAVAGGGRYYASEDMSDVPQIFLQETIVAVGNYLVEGPFVPAIAYDSPILHGLGEGLPWLYGYNGSTLKNTARTVLVSDDQSPVLAQWQYGLGRSIAWTSDAKGKWAVDWVQWKEFPRFAAQMIGWVLPTSAGQGIETEVRVAGTQTTIAATVSDASGQPRENLHLTAVLVPSNAASEDEQATHQEVPLNQVSPGKYQATMSSPPVGTYLVQIRGGEGEQEVMQHVAGLVVPYSSEYRQDQGNPALLDNLLRLTGGRLLTAPEMAFEHNLRGVARAQEIALPLLLLALLLLPFDIGVRRLLLRRSDLATMQQWLHRSTGLRMRASEAGGSAEETLSRLARAKSRAVPRSQERTMPVAPPVQHPPLDTERPIQRPVGGAKPGTPPPTSADGDPLERLRAARDRARRRARGEE